jgi:hypothetical protein
MTAIEYIENKIAKARQEAADVAEAAARSELAPLLTIAEEAVTAFVPKAVGALQDYLAARGVDPDVILGIETIIKGVI